VPIRAETERHMNVHTQISDYLAAQSERKRGDLQALHGMMLRLMPDCRLWFLDGKDESGRTVSNPNIGYGLLTMAYADGRTREFYQVGLSANTTGMSVYIMGLDDKAYLAETYGGALGKARVTGYCIRFATSTSPCSKRRSGTGSRGPARDDARRIHSRLTRGSRQGRVAALSGGMSPPGGRSWTSALGRHEGARSLRMPSERSSTRCAAPRT
jgi:hypothetical protein